MRIIALVLASLLFFSGAALAHDRSPKGPKGPDAPKGPDKAPEPKAPNTPSVGGQRDPNATGSVDTDTVFSLVALATLAYASASAQAARTIAVYYDGDGRCKDEAAALNRKSGRTVYACIRGLLGR